MRVKDQVHVVVVTNSSLMQAVKVFGSLTEAKKFADKQNTHGNLNAIVFDNQTIVHGNGGE